MKELCFNPWYWLDEGQHIVAIAAKGYLLDGTEDDKCAVLAALSGGEYKMVPALAFEQSIQYSELKRRGVEAVYKSEFARIRRTLPKDVPFPEDKLYCATPLYDFDEGYVPALIGDGFITKRQ